MILSTHEALLFTLMLIFTTANLPCMGAMTPPVSIGSLLIAHTDVTQTLLSPLLRLLECHSTNMTPPISIPQHYSFFLKWGKGNKRKA